MLALQRRAVRAEEADLPQQRTGDGEFDCDDRLEVLNWDGHDG
jgi:hypothetical protein